jgi:hypothetical protein
VVTFPKAYHAGFSTGFGVGEVLQYVCINQRVYHDVLRSSTFTVFVAAFCATVVVAVV